MGKERGRPMKRRYPPRTDAPAEELAQALLNLPADHSFSYLDEEPDYRCSACGQEVHYPKTLYRNGRCEACRAC